MSKIPLISLYKKDIVKVYRSAIDAVQPDNLIKNVFSIRNNLLTIKNWRSQEDAVNLDLRDCNIHIIGGGKSVLSMACGLANEANRTESTHLFANGHLSLPHELRASIIKDSSISNLLSSVGIKYSFGSKNNLPDDGSVQASEAILNNIKVACERAKAENMTPVFIVLISGGGSACLSSPKYINLEKKLQLIKFLVQKGADIVELNKVRRYFSNLKGGQLALHILRNHPDARILSLILSDVINDPVEYIASGPTHLNHDEIFQSQKQSMVEVLNKYRYNELDNLLEICPDDSHLSTGLGSENITNYIIGNNNIALNAAFDEATLLGYNVVRLGNDLQGSSIEAVKRIVEFGKEVFEKNKGRNMVICGGEVTIDKLDGETWGIGGRAQEMALDYMMTMIRQEKSLDECQTEVFLAGGTDGQDGPTDVAACLASYCELKYHIEKKISLEDMIKAKTSHDSYNFWREFNPDWLLKTGLTETNVMDLYLYIIGNE